MGAPYGIWRGGPLPPSPAPRVHRPSPTPGTPYYRTTPASIPGTVERAGLGTPGRPGLGTRHPGGVGRAVRGTLAVYGGYDGQYPASLAVLEIP